MCFDKKKQQKNKKQQYKNNNMQQTLQNYTQDFQAIAVQAQQLAAEKNHQMVSTEHYLYILLTVECFPELLEVKTYFKKEWELQTEPLLEQLQKEYLYNHNLQNKEGLQFSHVFQSLRLQQIYNIFHQFKQQNCQTFFLSMLLENTNIGSQMLREMSKFDKNSENYAQYFKIDISSMKQNIVDKLKKNVEKNQIYKEFTIFDKILKNDQKNQEFKLPQLPSDNKNMIGPNNYSNYIVPNLVLNGRCPGGYNWESQAAKQEISDLILKGNVTTFVCLIGEIDVQEYKQQLYPRFAQDIIKNTGKSINFILYPIEDFYIQDNESTINFVSILKKRVLNGEILYIHCLGGHGRTGTISIPLLQQLYGLNSKQASDYVNLYHDIRPSCRHYGSGQHMPEAQEQYQQIKQMSTLNRRGQKHKN